MTTSKARAKQHSGDSVQASPQGRVLPGPGHLLRLQEGRRHLPQGVRPARRDGGGSRGCRSEGDVEVKCRGNGETEYNV